MPDAGFNKSLKEQPIKTIGGILTVTGAMFGIIWGINANLVFKDDIKHLATSTEVERIQTEIITEVRTESAKIRIVYLHDLESRLESVEVKIDELVESGSDVPSDLRRSAKRLQNRINEITGQ